MSYLPGLVATIILFLLNVGNWHITNSIDFYPDALSQETFFILVRQSGLKRKKGSIIAMVMDPTADNIDLIDFSLTNNGRCCSQQAGFPQ